MNKQTRIGLIVLITIVLLLVITIPSLAKKEEPYQCHVDAPVVSNGGHISEIEIYGELEAYWKDGTLFNYCTGVLPFGEPLEDGLGWRYLTFDEVCEQLGDKVECNGAILYSDKEIWETDVVVYNPDTGELLAATDYSVTFHKKGDFTFYKEYVP